MSDPTIHVSDDDGYPVRRPSGGMTSLPRSLGCPAFGTSGLTQGGVQDAGEDRGAGQRTVDGRKRSRRAFGTVEQLPSGRFRARVIGPEGRYVSAPSTFASRTDASMWVDVQHADLVRGTWRAPVKPSASPSVADYVARWIEEHPTARDSTKELYRGFCAPASPRPWAAPRWPGSPRPR